MLMSLKRRRTNRFHNSTTAKTNNPIRFVMPGHGAHAPRKGNTQDEKSSPSFGSEDDSASSAKERLPHVHHPSFHASGAAGKYREFSPLSFETPVVSESFCASVDEKSDAVSHRESALRDAFLHLNYRRWTIHEQSVDANRGSVPATRRQMELLRREADEIRNWIVEENEELLVILSSRFFQNGVTLDELQSEAITVLLRAIDRFDVESGVQFNTYASTAINRHLQRWLGSHARSKSQQGSMNELKLDPVSEQVPSATKDLQQEESIHAALNSLPKAPRRVVSLRFGFGNRGRSLSFRAIAERLGMSREQARRLCMKALSRLRTHPALRDFELSI